MLMQIVRDHFPDVIVTCLGPPLLGFIDEEDMGDLTYEQLMEVNENYADAGDVLWSCMRSRIL